jgi:repressor LexA
MTFGITSRERDALAYIQSYALEHLGVMPSLEEIAAALGLKSRSGAHRIVNGLESRGHLVRLKHRERAIKLAGSDLAELPGPTQKRLLDYAAAVDLSPGDALRAAVVAGLDVLEKQARF